MSSPAKSNQRTLEVLTESQMYRDYERAFTEGTGLPLRLHGLEMLSVVHHARNQENPFCTLMVKTNHSCSSCYALQQKLEEEAQFAPKTLKCFAGLCETAVPVRVGENVIVFPRRRESRSNGSFSSSTSKRISAVDSSKSPKTWADAATPSCYRLPPSKTSRRRWGG